MKIEIRSRYDGSVIFIVEAASWKLALEAAITSRANLRDADLGGADLRDANLRGADLRDASLRGASLRGASLRGADLRGADLRGADLRDANLRGADLGGANLGGANLRGADLRDANLWGADLWGANLGGASLRGAKHLNPYRVTPLLMLLDQFGPIRAYKLVTAAGTGPFNGGISYRVGEDYAVDNANTDTGLPCAAGIHLATLDWCMKEWREGYRILVAEFVAADIAAIPTATDGKFRVRRCRIVGEKDLAEIGLREKEQKQEAGR